MSYILKNTSLQKEIRTVKFQCFMYFIQNIVKESYTILFLSLTRFLIFETVFIFQGKTYLASFESREN